MTDPKATDPKETSETRGAGFRQDSPGKLDKQLPENSKENLDDKLDHALEETFPTSDPISVKITK